MTDPRGLVGKVPFHLLRREGDPASGNPPALGEALQRDTAGTWCAAFPDPQAFVPEYGLSLQFKFMLISRKSPSHPEGEPWLSGEAASL